MAEARYNKQKQLKHAERKIESESLQREDEKYYI
jgi:hypothetical protein